MRDGSTHRRRTCVRSTRWHQAISRLHDWRRNGRVDDLWALTQRAHGLDWSRSLLNALLEELHVSDDFDKLVGPVMHAPGSQYPRLLVIALLVRHSWSPADLERTATRLRLLSRTSGPRASTLTTRASALRPKPHHLGPIERRSPCRTYQSLRPFPHAVTASGNSSARTARSVTATDASSMCQPSRSRIRAQPRQYSAR